MYLFSVYYQLCFVKSQTAYLKGKVLDADTKEPIPFANVIVANTKNAAVTDFDGNYKLKFSASGKFDIKVSYIGYKPKILAISKLKRVIQLYLIF